jgi:DNA end-binding protein Ku
MAARSIASLSISFGLVSIPVKLYTATEASRAISFNMLHKDCGSRLKQQYICIKDEVPVAREDIVKGYEFSKDQYVIFTPDELKAMEEAGTHMADITEFVPLEAVDPVYFDKAYYLAPDKGGTKPYALRRAWPRNNRAATEDRDDPPRGGRARHAAAPLRGRGARDEGPRNSGDGGQTR